MKFIKFVTVFLSFGFLSFSPNGDSIKYLTTGCQETFHFFFLTKGKNPTFWIGIDISGECNSSHLVQISVNDSSVSVLSTELKEYKTWEEIKALNSMFETYAENRLGLKDDIWIFENIKISAPQYDSILAKEFNNHIIKGGGNAYTWYKEKGNYGVILPKIEELNTDLIYRHDRGLYFNYKISEAYYFPNNYLLIFTNQPKLAVGDDSMHGFFIFKIKEGA